MLMDGRLEASVEASELELTVSTPVLLVNVIAILVVGHRACG